MMELQVGPDSVDFVSDGTLAGCYHYQDAFKPYVHPLMTPSGRTVSLAKPHDHPHHKGLMYALRTRDLNFWEERVTLPGEVPGRQRHDGFLALRETGALVGFDQALTWSAFDSERPTFRERRSLECHALPQAHAFEWTWTTELTVLRTVELILSQWSAITAAGARVNYHGLGLRFIRDFDFADGCELTLDGVKTPFVEAMGKIPKQVTIEGKLDGEFPVQKAGVRVSQVQANPMFVCTQPFTFVGVGPSNLAPLTLAQGQVLRERYVVTVYDVVEPASNG